MEELLQRFPLSLNSSRARVPFLPGDMLQVLPHPSLIQDPAKFLGGVAEPFWVTSLGAGVWVGREQPLWYRWNREGDRQMCLSVEHRRPYVGSITTTTTPAWLHGNMPTPTPQMAEPGQVELEYTLCARQDPRDMFQHAAGRLWRLPSSTPDPRMVTQPVWSTWARYKQDIN